MDGKKQGLNEWMVLGVVVLVLLAAVGALIGSQLRKDAAREQARAALIADWQAHASDVTKVVRAKIASGDPTWARSDLAPYEGVSTPDLNALRKEIDVAAAPQDAAAAAAQQREVAAYQEAVRLFGRAPDRFEAQAMVATYLSSVVRDPSSLEVEGCLTPSSGEHGWVATCRFHARNGFGGMNREVGDFTINRGSVVSMAAGQ